MVARLKWGDPFVFDSGGQEALFLHEQGDSVRGGARHSRGDRGAGVRRRAGHVSGRRRHRHAACADTRTRAHDAPKWTGRSLARLEGTVVCYAGAQQLPAMLETCSRTAAPRTSRPPSIYDGTLPASRRSTARSRSCSSRREPRGAAARDARRRPRRRAARASALVRRRGPSSASASWSRARASRRRSSSTCSKSSARKPSKRR